MTEVKPNIEITQRAVVETKAAATTHKEREEANLVNSVIGEIKKGNTEEGLQLLVKQEDDATYTANVDRVISVDKVDGAGKPKPSTAEKARVQSAKDAITLVNKAVNEGWPTTAVEQTALVNAVKPVFSRMWPEARAFFADTTHGEARMKAFIARELQNPRTREILQQMLEQRSGAKPPADLEMPAELRQELAQAEIAVAQNTRAQARVDAEIGKNKADLSREYGDPDVAGSRGARNDRLDLLRTEKGTHQSEVSSLTRDIAAKEARIAQLQASINASGTRDIPMRDGAGKVVGTGKEEFGGDKAKFQTEIDLLTDQINNATTGLRVQLRTHESALTELKGLEDDLAQWTADRQRLSNEKQNLADDGEKLAANLSGLKRETQKIVRDRLNWEQKYIKDLQKIMSDGMEAQYKEQLDKAEAAQKKLLEEEAAKATDPAEKQLLEQMGKRWDKRKQSGFIRTKEVNVPNKANIDRDYKSLMLPPPKGGPEALMRSMLEGTQVIDQVTGNPRDMTDVEINAKLADKEFVEKMQGQVVNKLLTQRLKTARIPEGDLDYMADNTDWGKSALRAALGNREAVAQLRQQMQEAGVTAGAMHEFFSDKGKKKGALLGLLLSVITLGVVPAIMLKESIKGQVA